MPDEALTDDYLIDQMLIAGTVDEVVDRLLAFREKVLFSPVISIPTETTVPIDT